MLDRGYELMTNTEINSLYTDGACSGNPGPGGWGVVVCFTNGNCYEMGGFSPATTNNRMEMQAAIEALQFLAKFQQKQPITLYTDSEYLKNGITKWIKGWKRNNWTKASGEPVVNQDLWEILDQLNFPLIKWEYVRGHSGNVYNERCDVIARAFSLKKTPDLKQDQPIPSTGVDGLNLNSSRNKQLELKSEVKSVEPINSHTTMIDLIPDSGEILSREERIGHIRNLVETLKIADEIASKGYFITSSELADLMDVNASAVTSRGDRWVWRNWEVWRVRREGNQILWQLERVEKVNIDNINEF